MNYTLPYMFPSLTVTGNALPWHCEERECNGEDHSAAVVPPRRLHWVQVAWEALQGAIQWTFQTGLNIFNSYRVQLKGSPKARLGE